MVELEFDPQVGEQVEVFGQKSGYEIIGKYAGPGGAGTLLDLKRLRDGKIWRAVQTIVVDYPLDEQIRRALQIILADSNAWPEDFQRGQFEVKTEERYDESPGIMIRFHLKPGVTPSLSKAAEWNDFYAKLRPQLEPIMDSCFWLQFAAKEERDTFSAAS